MDWKLRKQKPEIDAQDAEEAPESAASFGVAQNGFSTQDTVDANQVPVGFFDLNDDTFKTDRKRTALDHNGSLPWQIETGAESVKARTPESSRPRESAVTPPASLEPAFTPFPGIPQEPAPPGFREDYAFPQAAEESSEPLFTSTEEMLRKLQADLEAPKPAANRSASYETSAFTPYQPQQTPPEPSPTASPSAFTPLTAPPPPAQPAAAPTPPAQTAAAPPQVYTPEPPTFTPPPTYTPPPAYEAPAVDREAFAPGLVASEGDIPSVAPFIVDMPIELSVPQQTAQRRLVLHLRNLSANYPLTKDVTTIGRPDAPTQTYPDVEIELDDSVSRRHAKIIRRNDDFYLVDVGSTNGTLLNGQKLAPNKEMLLSHGDRIRVGDKAELTFE